MSSLCHGCNWSWMGFLRKSVWKISKLSVCVYANEELRWSCNQFVNEHTTKNFMSCNWDQLPWYFFRCSKVFTFVFLELPNIQTLNSSCTFDILYCINLLGLCLGFEVWTLILNLARLTVLLFFWVCCMFRSKCQLLRFINPVVNVCC